VPADGDYETKRTTFGGCEEDCGTLEIVLGEQEAVVLDVKPWDLHGVGWDYDLGYGVIDAAAALKALRRRRVKATA